MFYGGDPNKRGRCAAGGAHVGDESTSFNYGFDHDFGPGTTPPNYPPYQNGWRFCRRCLSMAYGLNGRPVEGTNSWLSNFGRLRRNTDRKPIHRLAQFALAVTFLLTAKLIDWRNRWSPNPSPIR